MRNHRKSLFFSLFAAVGAIALLFSSGFAPQLLKAENTQAYRCADITFGTGRSTSGTAITNSTSYFSTTNLAIASLSIDSVSSATKTSGSTNALKLGSSSTTDTGGVTFTFSTAIRLLAINVQADPISSTHSGKVLTVSTEADSTGIGLALTYSGSAFSSYSFSGFVSTTASNWFKLSLPKGAIFYISKVVFRIAEDVSTSSSSALSSLTSSESYSSSGGGTPLNVYAIEQTGKYGDCTLFKYGNYEILFDFGNTSSQAQLAEALNTYVTDHVLELVVLTHPHTDHYGGVYGYTTSAGEGGTLKDGGITGITRLVDNGADGYSAASYSSYWVNGVRSYWVGKGTSYTPIETIVSGHMYDASWVLADQLSIQWLDTSSYPTPGAAGPTDANDGSVACDVKFGTYDFVMCGDLPIAPEETLKTNYASHPFIDSGDTVVFKACHHCSSTSNSAVFLEFIHPTYGFTESGIIDTNEATTGPSTEQHPYKDARQRIETYTGVDHFWWVGTCGTLVMEIPSDCSSFSIHGLGRKYGNYYYNGALVNPDSEKDTPLESTKWAASGY